MAKEIMGITKRREIRRAVRKYCRENNINGKQLADATGISQSATTKLLSDGKNATKTIRSYTAEVLELWLRTQQDDVLDYPDEGTARGPDLEALVKRLEHEIRWKDARLRTYEAELERKAAMISEAQLALRELQGNEPTGARYLSLLNKYNTLLAYVQIIIPEQVSQHDERSILCHA
jgi:transcriptional regulator with XRE-family HTH domain